MLLYLSATQNLRDTIDHYGNQREMGFLTSWLCELRVDISVRLGLNIKVDTMFLRTIRLQTIKDASV